VYVCCLERGKKRDLNHMGQFNQKMSKSAVQEADHLAQKLKAAAAESRLAAASRVSAAQRVQQATNRTSRVASMLSNLARQRELHDQNTRLKYF
jgi:hypothetical protein